MADVIGIIPQLLKNQNKEELCSFLPTIGVKEEVLNNKLRSTDSGKHKKNIVRGVNFVSMADRFDAMIAEKGEVKEDDILDFLKEENTRLFLRMYCGSGLTNVEKQDLCEFVGYFETTGYESFSCDARLKKWENDAFLLNLVTSVRMENAKEEVAELKSSLIPILTNKITNLCDFIIDRDPYKKLITIFKPDGMCFSTGIESLMQLEMDGEKAEAVDYFKNILFSNTALAFVEDGAILAIRTYKDDGKEEIYGIAIDNGCWIPVDPADMEEAYSNNDDEYNADNVVYIKVAADTDKSNIVDFPG